MMTPNNPYKTDLLKSHYNMSKKDRKNSYKSFLRTSGLKYFQHLWIEAFKKDQ